ncbi:hypothetical protein GCM10027174_30370 [Salinifilum aidingensis]
MRGTQRVVRAVTWLLLAVALVVLSPLSATAQVPTRATAETTNSQSNEHREEKLRERTPGTAVQRRCAEQGDKPRCLFKLDVRALSGADRVLPSGEHLVLGGNSHELSLRKRQSPSVLNVFRL